MPNNPNTFLTYLATPYSHPEAEVRESRFRAVNLVAANLMRAGHHIFSPISQTHSITLAGDLPLDWDYWEAYDRAILGMCSNLIVLTLVGWQESVGVQAEISMARERNIPVELIGFRPHCGLDDKCPDNPVCAYGCYEYANCYPPDDGFEIVSNRR